MKDRCERLPRRTAEVHQPLRVPDPVLSRAADLAWRLTGLDGVALIGAALGTEPRGKIALVSSFGTESAVLLALAAEVDPTVPVLFLDTGKLFGETRRYRDLLVGRLGLTDVRTLKPPAAEARAADPDGLLFRHDADACCHLRKVAPLERVLVDFTAWISGRKRYHGATRTLLPVVETDRHWIKINPLVNWSRERMEAEFERRGLPRHPLEADGFLSIGCMPCSARVAAGMGVRDGRWAGRDKTECGIHRRSYSVEWCKSLEADKDSAAD